LLLGLAPLAACSAWAQQPIAYSPTQGVTLTGALSVADGKASIGNNGSVTAGDQSTRLTLARGGELLVCASTRVNLSRDSSAVGGSDPAADSALMIALDRGAIETDYVTRKYSDVLLTPDLRILISAPGQANLKLRVNQKGDTCVDNHGANAPYVTVTSQFEGGVYRVQPNQRVLFENGSLQKVVDNESEPCGCPSSLPVSVAAAGVTNSANPALPGQKAAITPVGGPSSTPADTAFPLAESEGLKPPPPPPAEPVVPAGVAHAQVEAPIAYNSTVTPNPSAPGAAEPAPAPAVANPSAVTAAPPTPQKKQGGFFHAIGRFFGHIFGRG
jgi:hypothetical protein